MEISSLDKEFHFLLAAIFIVMTIGIALLWSDVRWREHKLSNRVEHAQDQLEKSVDKSKPAWDVARLTLEAYFQKNLSQSSYIFWLCLFVISAGFGIILWGIAKSMNRPLDQGGPLAPELLATLAGVITQFIGVTFLVIYRSVLVQTSAYSKTLERINSVGMAMQILDTIPDDVRTDDLKSQTKAHMIDMLVRLSYEASIISDSSSSYPMGANSMDAGSMGASSMGASRYALPSSDGYGGGMDGGGMGGGFTAGGLSSTPFDSPAYSGSAYTSLPSAMGGTDYTDAQINPSLQIQPSGAPSASASTSYGGDDADPASVDPTSGVPDMATPDYSGNTGFPSPVTFPNGPIPSMGAIASAPDLASSSYPSFLSLSTEAPEMPSSYDFPSPSAASAPFTPTSLAPSSLVPSPMTPPSTDVNAIVSPNTVY